MQMSSRTFTSRIEWPYVALLFGVVLISFSPIWTKLSETSPTGAAVWRLLLGLPFLFIMTGVCKAQQQLKPKTKDYFWLLGTGFIFSFNISLVHHSLNYTSVAHSTLLVNTAPFFVVIYLWLISGHIPSRTFLMSLLLSFLGLILLIGPHLHMNQALYGDLLAIFGASFYGLYIVFLGQASRAFNLTTVMGISGLVAICTLLMIMLFTKESLAVESMTGWKYLIMLAILAHLGGQTLIAYSLKYLPTQVTAITLLLQPVGAALIANYTFNETLDPIQMIGMLVVLVGIGTAKTSTKH